MGVIYFVLARLGLALASVHPSATPIWPPTGFALAATLVWGYRMWPAILLGAFAANAAIGSQIAVAATIAVGNTLESLIIAWLINRTSNGQATFDTPAGVARFAAFATGSGTLVSASVGTATIVAAGGDFSGAVWLTWWLGDTAGALVVTPVVVLWALKGQTVSKVSAAAFAAAALIGLLAFAPVVQLPIDRAALAFVAVVPLLWAALRLGQRDTATVALILSASAVWGTFDAAGPFVRASLNDSLLLLIAFMISVAVPSLALAADVAERRESEERQRLLMAELDHRVRNILAVILATTRLSRGSAVTKEAYGRSLESRIGAMASVHELLTRRHWQGVDLGELVRETVQAHAADSRRLAIEGPSCRLKPRQAIDLALVLHELATNAVKYGALSVASGELSVRWRWEAANGHGPAHLVLLWWEMNGPTVRFPATKGFGSQLIESALKSHGGHVSVDFNEYGLRCRVEMPVDEAAGPAARFSPPAAPSLPPAKPEGQGRRVMVAEDEPVLGLELLAALDAAGLETIGPARTLEEAESLARDPMLAAAVLDVNLDGKLVFPVAERLKARGVQVLFVSGYDVDEVAPPSLRGTPVLQKPLGSGAVIAEVRRLLAI